MVSDAGVCCGCARGERPIAETCLTPNRPYGSQGDRRNGDRPADRVDPRAGAAEVPDVLPRSRAASRYL